jgi:hypothetical protein
LVLSRVSVNVIMVHHSERTCLEIKEITVLR